MISRSLKEIVSELPNGFVFTEKFLKQTAFGQNSLDNSELDKYLEAIGDGAWVRKNEKPSLEGGLHAIQNQLGLDISLGGITAKLVQCALRYPRLAPRDLIIFGTDVLPRWFLDYDWKTTLDYNPVDFEIRYYQNTFLSAEIGIKDIESDDFTIKTSCVERAVLECLHLTPRKCDLLEVYENMEVYFTFRPKLVQKLLEACSSFKVKRLFLCFAERHEHEWFNELDLSKIPLGSSTIEIDEDGDFDPKYRIRLPKYIKEFELDNQIY